MDLTCVSLLGFLIVLAFLAAGSSWLWRSARSPNDNKLGEEPCRLPPEPTGAWPLLGHLPALLGGKEVAARTLGRMADEYGPVFMLRLGSRRALVISSQEAARDCFTTWDRAFASRPMGAAGKHMGYNYSMLGFAPYSSLWRGMRKIATVELLTSVRLEKRRHLRQTEVDMRMRELHQLCGDGGGGGPSTAPVDMGQWLEDTTFNVIVGIVVGKRYFGGDGGDGEHMRRFQKALTELLYLMGVFVPSDGVPWLEWLDLGGYIKAMKRTLRELDATLVPWIKEHRQKVLRRPSSETAGKAEGDDQDFIDVMLTAVEGVDLGGLDPDTAIKATVATLIAGAMDTTAVTMTWALALLLNHRRVLGKVRRELDLHVGTARNVEEKDVPNLVYLQAVLKETQRLYPAAPLSIPHESTADCRVGGYHVPAGTRLLTNLWKLHRDPRSWGPDPEEFRPERFLPGGEAAGVDGRGQHFGYLPFGFGRRMCPGMTFGVQVTLLTLARLLHGFELETADGGEVDMVEGPGVTMPKATPLKVLVTSPHACPTCCTFVIALSLVGDYVVPRFLHAQGN